MAGSASVAAVVIPGATASAAALTVSCSKLTGTSVGTSSTSTLSGCTGSGVADTGTHGTGKTTVNLTTHAGTAKTTWASGGTTTSTLKFTEELGKNDKCSAKAGYASVAEAVEKGTVTGATGKAAPLKGGASTATVCVYSKKVSGKTVDYIFNKGPVIS
jgi:hypothetical protein